MQGDRHVDPSTPCARAAAASVMRSSELQRCAPTAPSNQARSTRLHADVRASVGVNQTAAPRAAYDSPLTPERGDLVEMPTHAVGRRPRRHRSARSERSQRGERHGGSREELEENAHFAALQLTGPARARHLRQGDTVAPSGSTSPRTLRHRQDRHSTSTSRRARRRALARVREGAARLLERVLRCDGSRCTTSRRIGRWGWATGEIPTSPAAERVA